MKFLWSRRNNRERDLTEEIRTHLEMASQDRAERGEHGNDANEAARREFGNVELVKETARDTWGGEWLHRIWVDARYAIRALTKSPGFCAIAVLTLGLGIGANTAIFSVIQGVLLAPLPYKDSSSIVQVNSSNEAFKGLSLGISLGDAADAKKEVPALGEMTIYDDASKNLSGEGNPQRVDVARVDNHFFAFLGTVPQLGRFFVEQDHQPGNENVAVLSDSLWRAQFGSDKNVLGKQLRLDGTNYAIIGVARPGFAYPSRDTFVWIPLAPTLAESLDHNEHSYQVLSRLQRGATLQQANNELRVLSARLAKENKNDYGAWVLSAVNLQEYTVQDARAALLILFAAALLLLMIACANLGNLLLTRGWQRHKEIALRSALGASPWRISQLLMTESVVLSVAGGGVGLVLAVWGVAVFKRLAPDGIPRIDELHADWTMALFALACSVLVGLIFGMLPAMQAARLNPNAALKETGTGGVARQWLRDGFAVMEIAMALALLIGAGLLVKGFSQLTHSALGFRTDHFLLMTIDLPAAKYPTANEKSLYVKQVLEKVQIVSGVEHAALSTFYPLSGNVSLSAGYKIEGDPESQDGIGNVETDSVTPGYFQMMGVPILRGRGFSIQDDANGPRVVVISETLARQSWNGRNPVGMRISGIGAQKGSKTLVVGVAKDVRDVDLSEPPRPKIYYPMLQDPRAGRLSLLVRAKSDPAKLAPALQEQIWSVDKDQPITGIETMEAVLAQSVADPRFRAVLLGTFAALGLILASIGIYGVVSYSVSLRTREIGVRMALGAQKNNVLQLVMKHGLRLAGAGITVGLAGALMLTKFLASLLFGVSAHDPWIFAGVVFVLAAAAMAACYVPARRAMQVDPLVALRYE